jgi:Holliday junction resolvasome RuvABC endonuclease subunit
MTTTIMNVTRILCIDPGPINTCCVVYEVNRNAAKLIPHPIWTATYSPESCHRRVVEVYRQVKERLKEFPVSCVIIERTPIMPRCCRQVLFKNAFLEGSLRSLFYNDGLYVVTASSAAVKGYLHIATGSYAGNKKASVKFATDNCPVAPGSDHEADCFCMAYWFLNKEKGE